MKTKEFTVNSNLNTIGGDLDEIEPEIMQKNVFNALRKSGWRQVPWKRHVILSFDTVSCRYLNPKLCEKELELIPPVILLFAIQIVNTRNFQPIGRVFCQKSVSPSTVASCIKSFIRDLMRCEYFVIATVCRPILFFRKIIECLVEIHSLDSKVDAHLYKVEFLKIVHFYDPVTMIEQVFLLFLKYSITYKLQEKQLLATYNDCKKTMIISTDIDVINDVFKHSNNIICAVRLFSMTFYRTIQSCITEGKLKDTGTAEFIAFFDMLFDTLHGDLSGDFTLVLNRKPLSKLSSHSKIWHKFLIILPTMKVLALPGELVPGKNGMGKNVETNLVDETEFYEVTNTFPKSDVSVNVDRTKRNLLQRINELEMESQKLSEDAEENFEDNLQNVRVKYYEDSDCGAEDFEDKTETEFYVSIDDLNNATKDKFQDVHYEEDRQGIAESASNKPINLAEYSKKLYFVLKDSECTDMTTFYDYTCTKSVNENVNVYISENNEFIDEEVILMQDYEDCAVFAIRHFGVYLDYSEYFIDVACIYKRTNCIKIILEEEALQHNGEEYIFIEDDYIDESQIAYSDGEIIIGEPLDRYADLRMQPSVPSGEDKIITGTHELKTSVEKGTMTDDLPNDQSQGVNVISNDCVSHKYFNISTVDTVFDILIYISKRLTADKNYTDTITDIVNYINKFIISSESKLKIYTDNVKEQTNAIYDVIVRMLTMLALSKTNADEQKNAYTKAVCIQLQLHTLASKYEKVQEQQNKKEAIYSIPSFFNSHNEKACVKDNEVRTTEYDVHINFSKIHGRSEKLHSKIQTESKQIKDDSPMEVDSEDEKEVSNPANLNDDDNDFEPYVFDALQISINGAMKLFEFLKKKRFTSLDMNSLNIDHLRQIIYNFRANHGISVENNYHIKITFIDPDVVTDVFETDDAIILD